MRPALRQQHYGEALMAAAETIGATIAKAKNVTLTAQLPRRIHESPADSIPWPSIVFAGVAVLLFLVRAAGPRGRGGYGGGGGGFLTGMILGDLLSRGSWGGRGSGGFGGPDSGDGGFGGFGGGDSGGGGASSDW
jgi:uncharacterized protein